MSTQATITEYGIAWPKRRMDLQKDIRPLCATVKRAGAEYKWGSADLCLHWAEHVDEPIQILADWLGIAEQTVSDRASVARKFPLSDRDQESDYLTYSHYRALCAIESHADRIRWRDRAATERIPVAQLRRLIAGEGSRTGDDTAPESPARSERSEKRTRAARTPAAPSPGESRGFNSDVTFTPAGQTRPAPVTGGIADTRRALILLPDDVSARLIAQAGSYDAGVRLACDLIAQAEAARRAPIANERFARIETH